MIGRRTKVRGDWVPDEAESYPAVILADVAWNGWVCPGFDRETALRVVADVQNGSDEDDQLVAVDHGGRLTIFHMLGPSQREDVQPEQWVEEVYEADADGHFAIGAFSWCWWEDDENEAVAR